MCGDAAAAVARAGGAEGPAADARVRFPVSSSPPLSLRLPRVTVQLLTRVSSPPFPSPPNRCATTLQSAFRSRRMDMALKHAQATAKRSSAAISIQCAARVLLARRRLQQRAAAAKKAARLTNAKARFRDGAKGTGAAAAKVQSQYRGVAERR